MLFKKSTLNIMRSRTRSALTMTGIAVGAFAVALISQISATGAGQVSEILENMGINTVLVQAKQANTTARLDDSDIISLGAINGVDKAMPLMSANARVEILEKKLPCLVWGINGEAREIISLRPLHGRLIDGRDISASALVCVIDEDIARKTYGRSNIVGKKINLLIGGAYRKFEVIGVAGSGLSVLQSALAGIIPDFVYIPFSTMQELTGRETYDKIAVLLDPDADRERSASVSITQKIETKLSTANHEQELIASNLLQQKNQLQGIMGAVTFALSVIAGISLFVAGLTVMTTMLVSVSERTREIGIKKSVGAGNFDIMREFLTESALLALIGSAAGSLAALTVSLIGCGVLGIGFVFSVWRFLSPVMFSLLLGMLFGVYPALKAANMKPIDALRI
ncbi:MAG: ABC transporter permease [Oscillospiraceae bacterium]|jgi:putative ABC transport system permease protein|nr:ABC transporter permease [Oscillospiraceae bacterium]